MPKEINKGLKVAKGGRKSNNKKGENDSILTESQNPEGGNIGSSRDTMINRSNAILESPENIAPIVTPFVRNSDNSSYFEKASDDAINTASETEAQLARVMVAEHGAIASAANATAVECGTSLKLGKKNLLNLIENDIREKIISRHRA